MTTPEPTVGVLCIHGFLGSADEYAPLEDILRERGYHTGTLDLPGHGPLPDAPLSAVTAERVFSHVQDAYADFAESCDAAVVVGHSLGGLCALLLAATGPDKLRGVVSLAAPYELAYTVNHPFGWVSDWMTAPVDSLMTAMRYLPEAMTGLSRPEVSYPWLYPILLRESSLLLDQLRQTLPDIRVPVCLGHSCYDLTVPYGEMAKLADILELNTTVRTHTFDHCGHQIFPNSLERDRAIQLVLDFLDELPRV